MDKTNTSLFLVQDEKALYDAARRGDVSAVKRLIAGQVNVDCTPYQVYHHIRCMYVVCSIGVGKASVLGGHNFDFFVRMRA